MISEGRNQRDAGALEGLTDRKAGRPKKDRTKEQLAELRERVQALESELGTANELIEAQGKVSALLQALFRKSADQNSNSR